MMELDMRMMNDGISHWIHDQIKHQMFGISSCSDKPYGYKPYLAMIQNNKPWVKARYPFSSPMKIWPHPIVPVVRYQSQSSNIALHGGIEEHNGIFGAGEKIHSSLVTL